MDYTYATYVRLLEHIRQCGHAICPFRDVPAEGRYVILRHDIDYSVAKALEMAEVERRIGVRSTIFLLLSSPYYNLFAEANLRAARTIVAMGHEIGFHYDTDVVAGLDPSQQASEIARQAGVLGSMLGVEIGAIAQHNPSMTPVRVKVDGFVDAYSARYFKDIAYLSDSRRLFGTPDVEEFFRVHDREKSRRESFQAIGDAVRADVDERLAHVNAWMEADERRVRAR
jgi:hypothetical protein